MEPRRPRLNPDELQLLRWLLGGALILLSIATVFYLEMGSEAMAVFAAAGVLLALVKPALPARIPAWAHRLAFPTIVGFFAIDLWINRQPLPAVVRLDVLLLLYRGVSHRARRDDLQIIILGLFLIVVAGVLTVSLLFALQILIFTACALGLLMVVTIASSTDGGRAPKLAARGVAPLWAPHADWRRLFRRLGEISDWRLVVSGAALFLGVIALSGLLFLLIPRFQLENSLFLERFISRRAMTGFNDSIKFGDITEITQDDGIAFDVDLTDPAQAPANPYWRMIVLDDYHNGGFALSAAMRKEAFKVNGTGANLKGQGRIASGAPTWTFYLEAGVSRYLPVLGRFTYLHFREAQNFRYAASLQVVALRDEPASMTAYRIEDMAPDTPEISDGLFAARWRNRAVPGPLPLQLSLELSGADKAAVAGVVAAIPAKPGPDVRAFAQEAGAYLRRQHRYSLTPRIPAGPGDPLVRWMTSQEPGHCELFAGALVLIARSAGIPAHIVTGFKGGTWNAYSGNYTIRNSDAHAWAEVWDERARAWLRADPLAVGAESTSEAKGEAALAPRTDRSWSARINSIRVFWYRQIVNFDQQTQAETFQAVKNATDNSGKWIRLKLAGAARHLQAWFRGPWNLARLAVVAGVAAWTAVVSWFLSSGRWRIVGLGGRKGDPVRREAGRWLTRLDGPPALVADLQRLRYGPRPTWPRPMDVFTRARQAARSRRRRASARNTS